MKQKIYKDETKDMKRNLFQWMRNMWKPNEPHYDFYRRYTGKSKTFKKNQRKGL